MVCCRPARGSSRPSKAPGAGQGWFEWGVTWGRHKSYPKLGDFQADLGIDKGSRVLDPGFANLNALDCRLKPEVMAALRP